MPFDPQLVYIVLLIVYLEGVLSIDNAAVLGAMVAVLPKDEPIPWSRPFRFLAEPVRRVFGAQRSAALKVGLLGAYLGRALMLLLATFIIHNVWLRILGGLYLIKLAFENLGEPEPGEAAQVDLDRVAHKGFWGVVVSVELADLAFSLDNVVAVVAISDEFWLVMFGVAMGILTMRFAAGIFTRLIEREPVLKVAAYALVLNIGIELLVEEFLHFDFSEFFTFSVSLLTIFFAIAYARVPRLHMIDPVLQWLCRGMANVNELADWLLEPLYWIARSIFKIVAVIWHRAMPTVREPTVEILPATSKSPKPKT